MRIIYSHHESKIIANLGNLKIAIPFFQSEILFLVGEKNNKINPCNKLIIWSDKLNQELGSIILKSDILDVLVEKYVFFVILKNKVLMFDFKNMKYITTFEDFNIEKNLHRKLFAVTSELNNTIISFFLVSDMNPNHIKIYKFLVEPKSGKITSKFQMNIILKDFKTIQHIEVDNKGQILIAVDETGRKLRLYSTLDYRCIYKFSRGNKNGNVTKICFDHTNKFFAVVSDSETIHFYKLFKFKKKRNLSENYASSFVTTNIMNTSKLSEYMIKNNHTSSMISKSNINPINESSHNFRTFASPAEESEDEEKRDNGIISEMINDFVVRNFYLKNTYVIHCIIFSNFFSLFLRIKIINPLSLNISSRVKN
jgi:hypothetical protein